MRNILIQLFVAGCFWTIRVAAGADTAYLPNSSSIASLTAEITDSFNDALIVNATNVHGTLENATSEPGEPLTSGISSGQTKWFRWTAPSNGAMQLELTGSNFFPFVQVYTGDSIANLTAIASNTFLMCYETRILSNALTVENGVVTACGCHWRFRDHLDFPVTQGTTYSLAKKAPRFS